MIGGMYSLLMMAGIVIAAWIWARMHDTIGRRDPRVTYIYIAALIGAVIGAKLAFLVAQGWAYRDNWLALLTGRSVTGALLGGYAAVELVKKRFGYTRTTGDAFAVIVPIGLMLGRVGCLIEGCCNGAECSPHWWSLNDSVGQSRWPIVPMEMAFNGVFLVWVLSAERLKILVGNRFHVYLIAYGVFRFMTEFARTTSTIGQTVLSGYHLIALFMIIFGVERFVTRARSVPRPH